MTKQKIPNLDNTAIEKSAYYDNQTENVNRFVELLGGIEKIEAKDMSKNFIAWALFVLIKKQGEFVKHIENGKHLYANQKQEKAILEKFETESKKKFGKEWDEWMKEVGKE